MTAPIDINIRIALAKGWEFRASARAYVSPDGRLYTDELPDFTGTLEGIAGMLRELGSTWAVRSYRDKWLCYQINIHGVLKSPRRYVRDKFGVAVGQAWMSMFGKEATDDRSE